MTLVLSYRTPCSAKRFPNQFSNSRLASLVTAPQIVSLEKCYAGISRLPFKQDFSLAFVWKHLPDFAGVNQFLPCLWHDVPFVVELNLRVTVTAKRRVKLFVR